MSTVCTNALLEDFSLEHYTYINQIFGDITVRNIIESVTAFKNPEYKFQVKPSGSEFESSFHHTLVKKSARKTICSADLGYQDMDINKNDTLCQSYSLLLYFKKPIINDPGNKESHKQNQMNMIAMYRDIVKNPEFLVKIDEIFIPENNKLWIDYTKTTDKKTVFVKMKKTTILKNINNVLKKWEEYGYLYFTGNGKCPSKKSMGVKPDDKSKSKST